MKCDEMSVHPYSKDLQPLSLFCNLSEVKSCDAIIKANSGTRDGTFAISTPTNLVFQVSCILNYSNLYLR